MLWLLSQGKTRQLGPQASGDVVRWDNPNGVGLRYLHNSNSCQTMHSDLYGHLRMLAYDLPEGCYINHVGVWADSHHSQESLHQSGRAIDIVSFSYSRSNHLLHCSIIREQEQIANMCSEHGMTTIWQDSRHRSHHVHAGVLLI